MTDRLLDLFKQLIEIESAKDSMELGPASSRLKIYGSFANEADFSKRIDAALSLRAYGLEKLAEGEAGP